MIAHDNAYNRWVAQGAGLYFTTVDEVDERLTQLLGDAVLRQRLGHAARERHRSEFTWDHVAGQYEDLLVKAQDSRRRGIGRSAGALRFRAKELS